MAVKIRLARRGRKKLAMYDVVVADARAPRDGRFIEKLGTYNPQTEPATININDDKAFDWVMKGAQPTDTVKAMLSYRGVMLRKHLQVGVNKGAITQEVADERFAEWLKTKEATIQEKVDKLNQTKAESKKSRKDAETKVKEARAESIAKRKSDAVEATKAAIVEAAAEAKGEEVVEEEVVEEVAAEAVVEETPKVEETPEVKETPAAEGNAEEAK